MTEFILQHPFWIAAVLLVLTAACTAHYKLHPGALNTADSAAYDTLLIAEAAIDQARTENQTQPFSTEAKDALNTLIRSYNVAREAWLTYRGAVATAQRKPDSAQPQLNVPSDPYFQQLNRNLSDLLNAIEALRERR